MSTMNPTYKAQAIAHDLNDRLKSRGYTTVESFDTDNCPLISIGSAATKVIIKVAAVLWPTAQDVLGNAALQYTPHVIQMASEANNAAGAGADNLARQEILDLNAQLSQMGTKVEWYEEAFGTPATAATCGDATKLKASWDPDNYRPMVSSQ